MPGMAHFSGVSEACPPLVLNEPKPYSLLGGARRQRGPRSVYGCELCEVFITDVECSDGKFVVDARLYCATQHRGMG